MRAGNAFFADSTAKRPPPVEPGTKAPTKPRTRLQSRVTHPMCARRARRAALCQRAHAARGKGAENRTKGTCAEQGADRGGRLLGQECRVDQARGARAASRSQRRGTISPGRAAGGSAEAFDWSSWRTLTSCPSRHLLMLLQGALDAPGQQLIC